MTRACEVNGLLTFQPHESPNNDSPVFYGRTRAQTQAQKLSSTSQAQDVATQKRIRNSPAPLNKYSATTEFAESVANPIVESAAYEDPHDDDYKPQNRKHLKRKSRISPKLPSSNKRPRTTRSIKAKLGLKNRESTTTAGDSGNGGRRLATRKGKANISQQSSRSLPRQAKESSVSSRTAGANLTTASESQKAVPETIRNYIVLRPDSHTCRDNATPSAWLAPPKSAFEYRIDLGEAHGATSMPFPDGEKLWSISRCIHDQARREPKPEPIGKPPVWSSSRTALAETLPYYRSFKSAAYCTEGIARAYLFDAHYHESDFMDSNVVISRAGGGMTEDASGKRVMTKDQEEHSAVQSLKKSMKSFIPVVIIVGQHNKTVPSKLDRQYSVTDWFKPTDIWWEKDNGMALLRYRFEKLRPELESWWKPKEVDDTTVEPVKLGSLPPALSAKCPFCQEISRRVYINGWMCLNKSCQIFFQLLDASGKFVDPIRTELRYDPLWLKRSTPWPHAQAPSDLLPRRTKKVLETELLTDECYGYSYFRGAVCPRCSACNLRAFWAKWNCSTPDCSHQFETQLKVLPSRLLEDPYFPTSATHPLSRDTFVPGRVSCEINFWHGFRVHTYEIRGVNGKIIHVHSHAQANEETNGPNDMFEQLQLQDIGLQRRTLKSGAEAFCNHFTMNAGMPYKFVASADRSVSFEAAPPIFRHVRTLLNWHSQNLIGSEHNDFNEVLALAYAERNKINYHDDGEKGLGPTIATLSLGYSAHMKLRMKPKYYCGLHAAGTYLDAAPIEGCVKYDERLAAHQMLEQFRDSPALLKEHVSKLKKQLGLKVRRSSVDSIDMLLNHGDIVIMHGSEIQKYYEHAVTPEGKVRFALTCRYIDPSSLRPEELPESPVHPDSGQYFPSWTNNLQDTIHIAGSCPSLASDLSDGTNEPLVSTDDLPPSQDSITLSSGYPVPDAGPWISKNDGPLLPDDSLDTQMPAMSCLTPNNSTE